MDKCGNESLSAQMSPVRSVQEAPIRFIVFLCFFFFFGSTGSLRGYDFLHVTIECVVFDSSLPVHFPLYVFRCTCACLCLTEMFRKAFVCIALVIGAHLLYFHAMLGTNSQTLSPVQDHLVQDRQWPGPSNT